MKDHGFAQGLEDFFSKRKKTKDLFVCPQKSRIRSTLLLSGYDLYRPSINPRDETWIFSVFFCSLPETSEAVCTWKIDALGRLITPWSKYMANRPQKVGWYRAYLNQYKVTVPWTFTPVYGFQLSGSWAELFVPEPGTLQKSQNFSPPCRKWRANSKENFY